MESIQVSKIDSRLRPQLLQEREKAIMLINEYSKLGMQQGTLAALRDSLGTIGLMFNNGGKETFVPEVIFYTRSRLHPVWAWLAKMTILSTWRNYATVNIISKSYTLVYAQLLNSRDTLSSIAEFKRIRQKPGWKSVIKGGQYAIDVSESGTCIHVILLGDHRCSTDAIKRYVELAWKKVQPGRSNSYLTVCNGRDPLRSFQTGFLKSLQIPNLSRIKSFHKMEGLFPVYKFGNLNGEVALNYEARLDEVIIAFKSEVMTPEDYEKKRQQQPIGGFKDPTGEYRAALYTLLTKLRVKTIAALMKQLITEALEREETKEKLETAIRYNENIKKTFLKWKVRNLWLVGFNLLLLLIHILYSIILK